MGIKKTACIFLILALPALSRAFPGAGSYAVQEEVRYQFCMNDTRPEASVAVSTAAADDMEEEYLARLKSDPEFFNKEKNKWLTAKANHNFYYDFVLSKNTWSRCLVPIGLGGLWKMAAAAYQFPMGAVIGNIDLLYGVICIITIPITPSEEDYNKRTEELNETGIKRGFIQ